MDFRTANHCLLGVIKNNQISNLVQMTRFCENKLHRGILQVKRYLWQQVNQTSKDHSSILWIITIRSSILDGIVVYSQTFPTGHLYSAVTCMKMSHFPCRLYIKFHMNLSTFKRSPVLENPILCLKGDILMQY